MFISLFYSITTPNLPPAKHPNVWCGSDWRAVVTGVGILLNRLGQTWPMFRHFGHSKWSVKTRQWKTRQWVEVMRHWLLICSLCLLFYVSSLSLLTPSPNMPETNRRTTIWWAWRGSVVEWAKAGFPCNSHSRTVLASLPNLSEEGDRLKNNFSSMKGMSGIGGTWCSVLHVAEKGIARWRVPFRTLISCFVLWPFFCLPLCRCSAHCFYTWWLSSLVTFLITQYVAGGMHVHCCTAGLTLLFTLHYLCVAYLFSSHLLSHTYI